MQNAGQQYGQGGASSHQATPFNGQSETTATGGSITSSLRQFRRKNEDKHSHSESNTTNSTATESHVARVAPHSHYPPRPTTECYRYPPQFPDYGLQQPVKYSEISEPHPPLQEHISPSVIQKAKGKEYMEMCNVQQQHIKPAYDHLNGQQTYPDGSIHPHAQYMPKEAQVHHGYKPESQYYPKEPQYSPQLPKYPQMPAAQVRKYPPENDFLSKLRRIHPSMARSIMSDHHLQETQSSYQPIDQNRMYPIQNQRYVNYPAGMQNSAYGHGYVPYSNYPASCSYNRPPHQMAPRFPPVNPHERSLSPRRNYPENMGMAMNYGGIAAQKISPGYTQYNSPEYAQHYQHRRAPTAQEYYQQHCRSAQYLNHQMAQQELADGRVTVSDSIKHYIENWADEETASEMNQIESSRVCKENIRGREEQQSTETVYMINASELQYLENELPLVASDNGLPVPVVASDSGQYILKSVVNGSEMMRLVEKTGQVEIDQNGDRVVNLHIMDTTKSDCMVANKPNESNQRQAPEPKYPVVEQPRVVVHQNTVINTGTGTTNAPAEKETENLVKIGTSLPIISDALEEELNRTLIKECRKETVDKNCSPINLDQLDQEESCQKSLDNSLVEEIASIEEMPDSLIDAHLKNGNSKTENGEQQTSNLEEVDDPHKHIDTLLDTINTPEAIETSPPTNRLLVENNCKEPVTSVQETSDISKEDSLALEENKTLETEQKSILSTDNVTPNEETIKNKDDTNKPQTVTEYSENCSSLEITKTANLQITTVEETDGKQNSGDSTTLTESLKEKDTFLQKPHEKIHRPITKRTKRIFSVDDIMNNIGKKLKHSDNDTLTRRHSLQTTEEFLTKEIKSTFKLPECTPENPNTLIIKESDRIEEKTKTITETNEIEEEETKITKVTQLLVETIKKNDLSTTIDESKDPASNKEKDDDGNKQGEIESTINDQKSDRNISKEEETKNVDDTILKECDVKEESALNSEPVIESEEIIMETNNVEVPENAEAVEETPSSELVPDLTKVTVLPDDISELTESKETAPQPEIQYRNVIRVEESSVLLEIAGELVEINVNNINGKNIVTVVPLSDTAVVDLNDNYETFENTETSDPLRLDEAQNPDEHLEVIDFIEDTREAGEVVETTSEIIIGMDLSLEEEIKLDVDQPPVIYTKAAKKAYDCDLQIPSITTSDDVLDSTRSNNYTSNDKVSSTKEKSSPDKIKNNKTHVADSSKLVELAKREAARANKKSQFKDLIAARNRKKLKQDAGKAEDDEFVPFKELVKARKLKKLKLLKMKSVEDSRVDSTIKIDEPNKASVIVSEQEEDVEKKSEVPSILKVTTEEEKKTEEKSGGEDSPKLKKRVSFSDISQEIQSPESKLNQSDDNPKKEVKNYKLQDPRLNRPNGYTKSMQTKKKLSLEEYNKRKRKLQDETKTDNQDTKKFKIDRHNSQTSNPERIKPFRTKSLDDLDQLKSKDSCVKRKLSVEFSPVKQNYFDWEETQSPKSNLNARDHESKFSEFKGLIGGNKTKPKVVINVCDLNSKPSTESSEDEILQNYKVQVESKLSTLNIQIPKVKPVERQIVDPFSKPETNSLIDRFLKNDKLNSAEMEKIRKIISYKRLVQQLKKIKSPDLSPSPVNPAYEVRKELGERDTKLLLKKVREKKKSRFRNLYSQSDSETEDDFREEPRRCGSGAYSVVQSNCLAGVVPKLIIKRKTEMPMPVVRLERLDLGLLDEKNSQYATV